MTEKPTACNPQQFLPLRSPSNSKQRNMANSMENFGNFFQKQILAYDQIKKSYQPYSSNKFSSINTSNSATKSISFFPSRVVLNRRRQNTQRQVKPKDFFQVQDKAERLLTSPFLQLRTKKPTFRTHIQFDFQDEHMQSPYNWKYPELSPDKNIQSAVVELQQKEMITPSQLSRSNDNVHIFQYKNKVPISQNQASRALTDGQNSQRSKNTEETSKINEKKLFLTTQDQQSSPQSDFPKDIKLKNRLQKIKRDYLERVSLKTSSVKSQERTFTRQSNSRYTQADKTILLLILRDQNKSQKSDFNVMPVLKKLQEVNLKFM